MGSNDNLHGVEGISQICQRLGPGWTCEGSETSSGFFVELLKVNTSGSEIFPPPPKHCPSFLLGDEQHWRFTTRALVYGFGLAYCFLGLAVITRIYMTALDSIVKHSKRYVHKDPITGLRIFSVKRIWNPTVADITLLALGTCAPQVSLAVIDAFQHIGDNSGNLGAGTLLGSTAFNLFLILAVCVVAPKRFQTKSIKNVGVYIVELVWSFWAYVWLFFILEVWTPNEITLWEAALTVAQFPVLVLHAYVQDKNWKYLSLPFREADTARNADAMHLHELANVSRSSKFAAMRCIEGSDSSAAKAAVLHFNDGTSDIFDEIDTRENFLLRESVESESFSWRSLGTVWKNQFYEAMSVSSGKDGLGQRKRSPSVFQLLLHPFVSYWKVGFAFIPPVQLLHGWLAFLSSICFITWISYVVVELSNRINCVTGISSYILALTILAAGTSFPNLFASKIAAEEYDTADSAVANINASNCINVYVGFGVPWCVSTLYASPFHRNVTVPVQGLRFLLSVYFSTAIACLVVLTARRRLLGGELGGPRRWAWASAIFFSLLWATFLTFACLADRFT